MWKPVHEPVLSDHEVEHSDEEYESTDNEFKLLILLFELEPLFLIDERDIDSVQNDPQVEVVFAWQRLLNLVQLSLALDYLFTYLVHGLSLTLLFF